MSEVSTWNAIDASNTATPPDGWPEGMQPSAVNDAARMMMGALRREHDLITAKIGSTPGAISTTTINATNITATNVTASGAMYAASLGASGNITASGTVTGTSVGALNSFGGSTSANGGATLRTFNNSDDLCFNWTGGKLFYRINNLVQYAITTNTNADGFAYSSGMGGPTGIGLVGYDYGGTNYVSYADFISDERIKENIAPTEVDALTCLQDVPVSRFDIAPRAAAWLSTVGKGEEAREAALAAPEAAHIPIGFVAQALRQRVPEAVSIVPQREGTPLPVDLHTIAPQALVPYLVRAIQQLAARVEALEAGGINV